MRCYIDNTILDTPQFNRDHNDYDPCPTCLEIIGEVFSDEPTDLDDAADSDQITEDEVDALLASWDRIDVV